MIDSFLPEGWKVGDVHQVRLPTYMNVSRKTSKALNLNIYRNLHHHHLNKQKQNFHDEVKPLIRHLPRAEKIWIHYTIFAPRKGRLDTMNVGSIVDKYFSDTLVEAKKIMDDHFDHVVLVSFSFGGVRPMDGHAIANIHILEKEQPMRILLDENDIQTALETYVETMGLTGANGVELSVEDGEVVGEVTMGEAKAAPKKTTRKTPAKRTVKTPTKPKPEVTADADQDLEDGGDGTDSAGIGSTEESSEDQSADEGSKTKGTKQGNLFGDEESPSSESAAKATGEGDTSPDGEGETPVKTTKKSSIFDVD